MPVDGGSSSLVAWIGGGLTAVLAALGIAVSWGRLRTLVEAQGKRMDLHEKVDAEFRKEIRKSVAGINESLAAIREDVAEMKGKLG